MQRAMFTAPKRYKYEDMEGITHIKAGGINFTEYTTQRAIENGLTDLEDIKEYNKNYKFAFEEVNIISSTWKVQRAYRVKGGTIIEFQNKEIKVPKKYLDIYERNVKMKV